MKLIAFSALCTEMISGSSVEETVIATSDLTASSDSISNGAPATVPAVAATSIIPVATLTKSRIVEELLAASDYKTLYNAKVSNKATTGKVDYKSGVFSKYDSTVGQGLPLADSSIMGLFNLRLQRLPNAYQTKLFARLPTSTTTPLRLFAIQNFFVIDEASAVISGLANTEMSPEISKAVRSFTKTNKYYEAATVLRLTSGFQANDRFPFVEGNATPVFSQMLETAVLNARSQGQAGDSNDSLTFQATKTQDQAMREFAKVATTTDSVTAEPEKKESASANGQDVKFLLLEDIMTDNDYTALCKIKNPHAQFDSLLDLKAGVYALFDSTVGSGLKLDDAAAQALFEDRLIELEDCDKEELLESLQEAKIENPVDKLLFQNKFVLDIATETIEEFGDLSQLDLDIQTAVANFTSGENRSFEAAMVLIDTLMAKSLSAEEDNSDSESIQEVESIQTNSADDSTETSEDESEETNVEDNTAELEKEEVPAVASTAEQDAQTLTIMRKMQAEPIIATIATLEEMEVLSGDDTVAGAETVQALILRLTAQNDAKIEAKRKAAESWSWVPKFLRGRQ